MTEQESKTLAVGDRVHYHDKTLSAVFDYDGVVLEIGYNAVKIEWSDKVIGLIDHRDMQKVSRLQKVES